MYPPEVRIGGGDPLTGKEEKSKLIVGRSGIWRQRFDFKRCSTLEDYMPISLRRLAVKPIMRNMKEINEMGFLAFGIPA
jgi:hypothetical protein